MTKQYHTVDTPNTQIHDRSRSWLGPATSMKCGGVKLVLLAPTSPLSEMMQACKCLPRVIKMPTLTFNCANSVTIKHAIILHWSKQIRVSSFRLPLHFDFSFRYESGGLP